METKRDIGSAFKDKLKELDKSPSDALWAKIETDLNAKKRRKPFLWLFPLVLVLGLSSGTLYYFLPAISGNEKAGETIKNIEYKNIDNQSHQGNGNSIGDKNQNSDNIVNSNPNNDGNPTVLTHANETDGEIIMENDGIAESTTTKVTPDQENPKLKTKQQSGTANKTGNLGSGVATNPNAKNASDKILYTREATRVTVTEKRLVKSTPEYDEYEVVKKYSYVVKKKKVKTPTKVKPSVVIASSSKNKKQTTHPQPKVRTTGKKKTSLKNKTPKSEQSEKNNQKKSGTISSEESDESSNRSIKEEETIAVITNTMENNKVTEAATEVDSVKTAPIPEKKKVKKVTADANIQKKDSIPPVKVNPLALFGYVSPTLSFAKGKNSPLDSRLNNNSRSSEIQWSYGAYLCYMPDARLSSRIGVGITNLNFKTENVPVNTTNYTNIAYADGVSNAVIYTESNQSETMTLLQDISYTEVPLEAKYRVLDRKIGINAIGGISILFLNKNKVSAVTANGKQFEVGKTKGVMDSSFGINFGFGFDYKINRLMKLNVEPMIKYNLKGYDSTSNSSFFSANILTGLQLAF